MALKRLRNSLVGPIVFVPRSQLRFTLHKRKLQVPAPRDLEAAVGVPTPPSTWDYSNGEKIAFPILGNDQVGDCYYTAWLHFIQAIIGMNGGTATFVAATVIKRYEQLSGGDNGLSDQQIIPEVEGGVVGPKGPHKILDVLIVPVSNQAAINLANWAFGGTLWTAALVEAWYQNAAPGVLWDVGQGSPDQELGHAMFLSGMRQVAKVAYDVRTWGLSPPVEVTYPAIQLADSEILVGFSMEWFNAQGYAPNGLHYTQLAALWVQCGGKTLPASPFPSPVTPPTPPTPPVNPPTPPVPPVPPPAGSNTLAIVGSFSSVTLNGKPVPFNASGFRGLGFTHEAGEVAPRGVNFSQILEIFEQLGNMPPGAISAAITAAKAAGVPGMALAQVLWDNRAAITSNATAVATAIQNLIALYQHPQQG